MKSCLLFKAVGLIIIILSAAYSSDTTSNVNFYNKRFECSLYGNISTISSNVYIQSDISSGLNFLKYMNSTITFNLQYRNYSLMTNEFISLNGSINLKKHRLCSGITCGLYTQRTGSYSDAVPCSGIELLYAYRLSDNASLCLKERIVRFSESNHKTTASSTLLGFCFSFHNVK
jgi:hypothetical protein